MESLSDEQIDQVYDLLLAKGLSLPSLRDELLDHICCIVELQMNNGAKFHNALSYAIKQFGPSGIERTQEATIYHLTKKHRKMKNTASILGIIGGITTIFGTLFKVMHWPGAGVLLLLGLAITSLLFMPTALYVNYQQKDGIKDRATIVAGFIGAFLLMIFALFKIMHWPGASVLLFVSLGELILIFIPLYSIKSYRNKENRWFDIGSLTVIMSGIIMVLTLYSFSGPSNYYHNTMRLKEQQSINKYQKIVAKINAKAQGYPSNSKQMQTHLSTLCLMNAFWEYRNSLLDHKYQTSNAELNRTVKKALESKIDQYKEWSVFEKQVKLFVSQETKQQTSELYVLIKMYNQLLAEINGEHILQNNELNSLLEAYKNIVGVIIQNDDELLLINYLNSIEEVLRKQELKVLS